MKNILVTTDLSEKSELAFGTARQLATAFDSEIHLLAIIEDPAQAAMIYALDFPVLPNPDIQEQLKHKVQDDVNTLAEKAFKDLTYSTYVREAHGPVHNEIIGFARDNDIDLLIIATHGRSGFSRLLIGSVAEKVVRQCPCPVLTVPCRDK